MKIVSKQSFLPALLAGNFISTILFAGLIISQQAFAADAQEEEANHPIAMAQFVVPGMEEYEIAAMMGNTVGDLDFYKFYGEAGDVITLDIDNGIGGNGDVDTIMAVFSAGPDFRMLRMNDDGRGLDPGSTHVYDSRIENFRLSESGVYYVGVSNYPRYFYDDGTGRTRSGGTDNGDYSLVISGVTRVDPTLHINIAIKPGNHEVAPLNPKSRGRVPVALLSADGFDPAAVVVESLRFGHDGDEDSLKKCHKPSEDLNNDGVNDMVCQFDNQMSAFRKGDLEGILKGEMDNGTVIEGRGLLKVVPEKAN